jgi:hypothetical protein
VSNPYRPAFLKSNRALLSSITDEIRAKPDGLVHVVVILFTKLTFSSGFFITYMGSAAGTSPGRLVETDDNFNIISEWPEDIAGTANILGENFNPHGLTVDWEKNIILTSDFVIPVTILKPSLGIVHDNTLRLWNLASRTIISTITIPNVSIAQTQKNTFTNKRSLRVAESKTSNSFPETTNLLHLLQRLPSVKSGSSTLSDMLRMDSKV